MRPTLVRAHRRSPLPPLELFDGCSFRACNELAALCTLIGVRAGRVLCRERSVAQECFIIVDGDADVFINGARVATAGRGDVIGELALLADRGRRTATVVAATDMRLLVLSRREFASLGVAAPPVLHRVLREATRRLVENAARH